MVKFSEDTQKVKNLLHKFLDNVVLHYLAKFYHFKSFLWKLLQIWFW